MNQMQMQIESAYQNHPLREEYEGTYNNSGNYKARLANEVVDKTHIILKHDRCTYKVANRLNRLLTLTDEVRKATCFNGKKTPKTRISKAYGKTFPIFKSDMSTQSYVIEYLRANNSTFQSDVLPFMLEFYQPLSNNLCAQYDDSFPECVEEIEV